jgi:ABC-type transporter Mla MlaB component
MLKISTQTDAAGTVFELEGKLAGAWVKELEACWQGRGSLYQPVKVVLKTVTFVDAAGRALLAEMHRQRAELVAEGCMTKAIVEEIFRGGGS